MTAAETDCSGVDVTYAQVDPRGACMLTVDAVGNISAITLSQMVSGLKVVVENAGDGWYDG